MIGRDDPTTRDVLAILGRFPGAVATRFGGKQLGGVSIEDAYIYPSYLFSGHGSGPMSQDEVLRELVKLVRSNEPERVAPFQGTLLRAIQFPGRGPRRSTQVRAGRGAPLQRSRTEQVGAEWDPVV